MDVVGNPSSVHAEGRAAKAMVERARGQVAAALGAEGADIVFVGSVMYILSPPLPKQNDFGSVV